MKQSHILAGVGVAMLVFFYVTSVQREGVENPPRSLETVRKEIKDLKSTGVKDDGTSTNPKMRKLIAEEIALMREASKADNKTSPSATPSSSTSTAAKTDLSGYIAKFGTAEELRKSLTDKAKSTYGSFLSVIASGIAKFGITVIVGASIVVGVLIVWSIWRVFVGVPSTYPSQLTGPSLVR